MERAENASMNQKWGRVPMIHASRMQDEEHVHALCCAVLCSTEQSADWSVRCGNVSETHASMQGLYCTLAVLVLSDEAVFVLIQHIQANWTAEQNMIPEEGRQYLGSGK